ncbi:uncharacterized protein LOC124444390 [Xenia sp. Carnegie-2017]|uniref:uncharacterized protein LOC124444390 n=1 Tax=Xenia sp. Carnegie-2017 TaxID=2897299 RepID=UPI001F04D5F6|nr:uncharacterized protein LOC124444390 [Xenia sp. Carnegie-2017]
MAFKVFVLLVVIILLFHQKGVAKPLKSRHRTENTELVREKREEFEDEEGSNEMQKFMLDLSSKEDIRRLNERFKSDAPPNIENDAMYRRLKRFSISDEDVNERRRSRMSKIKTMPLFLHGTIKSNQGDNEDIVDDNSSPVAKEERAKYDDQLEHFSDNISNVIRRSEPPYDAHKEGSMYFKDEKTSNEKGERPHRDMVKRLEKKKTIGGKKNEDFTIQSERKTASDNEHEKNGLLSQRNVQETESVNSHLTAGASWDLIHHNPKVNAHDFKEYEQVVASHTKSHISHERLARSIEYDYEMHEIGEMIKNDYEKPDTNDESDKSFVVFNKKAIRKDGYIGCYIDQHPNHDLSNLFVVNNLTSKSCRSVCRQKGHFYAGVQYGHLCHCGDGYGKYGEASEHECNSVCMGDKRKKCGGFWRNSVYTSDVLENEHHNDETYDSTGHQTRAHIDRIIPLFNEEPVDEPPIRQDITVYLRSEMSNTNEELHNKDEQPSNRIAISRKNDARKKLTHFKDNNTVKPLQRTTNLDEKEKRGNELKKKQTDALSKHFIKKSKRQDEVESFLKKVFRQI